MKARVKTTGEFIEVIPSIYNKGDYDGNDGYTYTKESLIMLKNEPDYWEKLKHQYAGLVMQGMLSNKELFNTITDGVWPPNKYVYIAERCDKYATALVNRLKEESQCEK